MTRLITLTTITMALLCSGIVSPASNAAAQQKSLREQLIGTWTFVSSVDTKGRHQSRPLGSQPEGHGLIAPTYANSRPTAWTRGLRRKTKLSCKE